MGLSASDYEKLIRSINELLENVPAFVKNGFFTETLPDYLNYIPPEFRNYKLDELMESIKTAWDDGKIHW